MKVRKIRYLATKYEINKEISRQSIYELTKMEVEKPEIVSEAFIRFDNKFSKGYTFYEEIDPDDIFNYLSGHYCILKWAIDHELLIKKKIVSFYRVGDRFQHETGAVYQLLPTGYNSHIIELVCVDPDKLLGERYGKTFYVKQIAKQVLTVTEEEFDKITNGLSNFFTKIEVKDDEEDEEDI